MTSDVLQACHLKKETFTYEEKERELVNDCVKELREYFPAPNQLKRLFIICSIKTKSNLINGHYIFVMRSGIPQKILADVQFCSLHFKTASAFKDHYDN